jgi:hypothetical protein
MDTIFIQTRWREAAAQENEMTEATSYQEVKAIALSTYWRGCLNQAASDYQGCVHAWTYHELDNSFDLPIENLMLEMVLLVLTSGSNEAMRDYHREATCKIILSISLDRELARLSPDDALELESDLRRLNFIPD